MTEQTDDWNKETTFERNNAELKRQMLGGANWFFWIAALSLVNSIIILFNGSWSFAVGLGTTQLFDAVGQAYVAGGAGEWLKTAVFLLDLVVVGLFALFGYFARKGNMMAFIIGLILYILDGILFFFSGKIGEFFLYGGAILGVIIHAIAIYFIFSGLLAARKLNEYK